MMVNQSFPSSAVSNRAVLTVSGEDSQAFLDAMTTNAIPPPEAGVITYAALLTPQGKLLFDAFVIGRGEAGYVLDVATSRAEAALSRLKLFTLRRKVAVQAAPEWAVSVLAPDAAGPNGATPFADPRLAGLAVRWLGAAPGIADPNEAARRIAFGVPDLAVDAAPDEVFALEGLLEELHGVDFKKGCFPGQENVSRMKRRATTRKKFCRVRIHGAAPAFGALVMAGAAEIGALCSTAGGIGIALLRLDRTREALAAGTALICAGAAITIDAPDWLIWPAEKDNP
jgi:folate-binding protein YgfZ